MPELDPADMPTPEQQAANPFAGAFPFMPVRDQIAFMPSVTLQEPYTLGEDSLPQEGVPQGTVTKYHWKSENIYPGTERDYWVYVPQQYDASKPACLMVFQDGEGYLAPDVNTPIVFDNLIHKGEMPVTIGLFVNSGDKGPGMPYWGGDYNRNYEYDRLTDDYARFLLEELIPELKKEYNITDDAAGHAICGISSGGICAFTVAWERPDAFSKVVTHCGSFVAIDGGNLYPSIVRRTPAKPIRVSLQSGTNDLNLMFGSWYIANQDMASALAYRDYDYQLTLGEGGHSLKHGASLLPDTLRWLWRDYES